MSNMTRPASMTSVITPEVVTAPWPAAAPIRVLPARSVLPSRSVLAVAPVRISVSDAPTCDAGIANLNAQLRLFVRPRRDL